MSLVDIIESNAAACPERTALVCGYERISFEQLASRSSQLAVALAGLGVTRGDRVVWLGKNCHTVVELLFACSQLGAMLAPGNWRASADELSFVLHDLAPRVVFFDEVVIRQDALATQARNKAEQWVPVSDIEDVRRQVEERDIRQRVTTSDPVLVLYTGAWQGTPSGSMLTHRNLLTQSAIWAQGWMFDAQTAYLACGPLFHIATWMSLIPALHVGGKVVLTEQADPAEICRLIAYEHCTNGLVLPQTIEKIVELNRDRRYDLARFRSFVRYPGWDEMVTPDDSPIGRSPGGYGQTEVTGSAIVSAFGPRPEDLTAGVPSPAARVAIVGEDGERLPIGEVGEIVVGGPLVHAGYWNRPELNEARMKDGWWHTGDLGRRNEDGTIGFIGPKGRMIKSGMENIYPVELEKCLLQHPRIREAAVIGIPDERWVQRVCAVVTTDAGSELTPSDVIDWCKTKLASYKKPSHVIFVEQLPRAGGAPDYDELDRRFGGGGYPGAGTDYLRQPGRKSPELLKERVL